MGYVLQMLRFEGHYKKRASFHLKYTNFRQLFIAVLIVVIQSILDYHHLDRPSKIVL